MEKFLKFPGLRQLLEFQQQKNVKIYVVGGAVRDLLLARSIKDLDLLVLHDVKKLAREFSRSYRYPCFPLHEERKMYRIVPIRDYAIDFISLQEKSLEADLHARDFTINAMAFPLDILMNATRIEQISERLVDPTGGANDLATRTIKVISQQALEQDPLRMLRAFRFQTELDFHIDPETLRFINQKHASIIRVARERILQELSRTLNGYDSLALQALVETRLLQSILSGVGCDHWWSHTKELDRVVTIITSLPDLFRKFHEKAPKQSDWLQHYLSQKLVGHTSRRALMLLLMFLPPFFDRQRIDTLGRNLTLSKYALKTLQSWWHAKENASQVLDHASYRQKELRRSFLYDHGVEALIGIFTQMLFQAESMERIDFICDVMKAMIEEYLFKNTQQELLLEQVSGKTVMEITGLPQGIKLGSILSDLHKAIYVGDLKNMGQVKARINLLLQ